MTLKPNSDTRWPQLLLALICLVFMAAEIANERFWLSDFEVYYKAALRLMDGTTLYRHPEDLHYVFKYSAVSAVFFIPFTLLPFAAAKVVYWLLLTAVIVYGFRLAIDLCSPGLIRSNPSLHNSVFLIAIPILAIHFLRELHLGQVNHLLLVAYMVMLQQYQRGKEKTTATLFAATLFLKPFTLIFLPYFLLKGRYRLVTYSFAAVALLSLSPLLFIPSWVHFISEYSAWINELRIEMEWKQGLLIYGNLTLFSVLARYTPMGFIVQAQNGTFIFQLIVLVLLAVIYLWCFNKGKGQEHASTLDFALLITTIPMLAYTSANAFGFSELAVVLVLLHWKQLSMTLKLTSVIAFILIGANFAEVIGKKLSGEFDRFSLVTVGAAMLIAVLLFLRYEKKA